MIATNKLLSTIAGLTCVGVVAVTSPAAHANSAGGSVAGNGGVAGMIDSTGSATGVANGAADPSFGGIGQPGIDLPGPAMSSVSTTTTVIGNGENPNIPAARQIARANAEGTANADYDVAQRNAEIQSQSRAALDAGLVTSTKGM
jgi:hypothetical protein